MKGNYEGNTLTAELLKKVRGGIWCPPWENDEVDGRQFHPTTTDGINDKGVYIGVNVPGMMPSDLIGACPNPN